MPPHPACWLRWESFKLFCRGSPQTLILLISTSYQVGVHCCVIIPGDERLLLGDLNQSPQLIPCPLNQSSFQLHPPKICHHGETGFGLWFVVMALGIEPTASAC
jgi:hypothetical protein